MSSSRSVAALALALSIAFALAAPAAADAPDPPQPIMVEVRAGDTLSSIAVRFNVSPQRLAEVNNLTGRQIVPGQILRMPAAVDAQGQPAPTDLPCAPRAMVLVQAGDTLADLARRWRVALDQLRADNGLSSDRLWVGQVLRIDCAEDPEAAAAATPAPEARGGPCGDPYTVRPGDTLQRIATRCGRTVAALKDANGLVTNVLMVGQALAMPATGRQAPTGPPAATPAAP